MIQFNKVLIEFDPHIEKVGGFDLSSVEDLQHHYSITGVVKAVPKKLLFAPQYDIVPPGFESMFQDADMELEVGDRVMFSYRAHFDKLVDYELIVAAIRDEIVPINGWLLVEVDEKPMFENVSGFTVFNRDVNIYGSATVKYAGKPNKRYIDGWEDDENIGVGSKIMFNKRNAVRMELDLHNSLTDRQSSLFRLQRRDVIMYEN